MITTKLLKRIRGLKLMNTTMMRRSSQNSQRTSWAHHRRNL